MDYGTTPRFVQAARAEPPRIPHIHVLTCTVPRLFLRAFSSRERSRVLFYFLQSELTRGTLVHDLMSWKEGTRTGLGVEGDGRVELV
jgi:hypothetical protein